MQMYIVVNSVVSFMNSLIFLLFTLKLLYLKWLQLILVYQKVCLIHVLFHGIHGIVLNPL